MSALCWQLASTGQHLDWRTPGGGSTSLCYFFGHSAEESELTQTLPVGGSGCLIALTDHLQPLRLRVWYPLSTKSALGRDRKYLCARLRKHCTSKSQEPTENSRKHLTNSKWTVSENKQSYLAQFTHTDGVIGRKQVWWVEVLESVHSALVWIEMLPKGLCVEGLVPAWHCWLGMDC